MEHEWAEDGPFVSFTDLFIGILFLFLILVAALMLMHQEAVQKAKAEAQAYNGVSPQQAQQMSGQIQQMQAQLDAAAKLEADHPAFRLAIVYNVYSYNENFMSKLGDAIGVNRQWMFDRTVRIFRTANGLCLDNVILQNEKLTNTWISAPTEAEIPTADQQLKVRGVEHCTLDAAGEHWNNKIDTRDIIRTDADLYSGKDVLHTPGGDETLDVQYRILGIYDDLYNKPVD